MSHNRKTKYLTRLIKRETKFCNFGDTITCPLSWSPATCELMHSGVLRVTRGRLYPGPQDGGRVPRRRHLRSRQQQCGGRDGPGRVPQRQRQQGGRWRAPVQGRPTAEEQRRQRQREQLGRRGACHAHRQSRRGRLPPGQQAARGR